MAGGFRRLLESLLLLSDERKREADAQRANAQRANAQRADTQRANAQGANAQKAGGGGVGHGGPEGHDEPGGFVPPRKLILWGWDERLNPSFAIFYSDSQSRGAGGEDAAARQASYSSFAVFKGRGGHFPAFEAVSIVPGYRTSPDRMYYKRDAAWHHRSETKALENFKNLREPITLAGAMTYGSYVRIIKSKGIRFDGFKLANTPDEVLKLPPPLASHRDAIVAMLSNPGIYMRKKSMREIICSQPPEELYRYLLNIGSTELVAGLFLELGLQKNGILAQEARRFIVSDQKWGSENYISGVKRCAAIYVDMFDASVRDSKIELIRKRFPEMDLHVMNITKNEQPEKIPTNGAEYEKCAQRGLLAPYYYTYDPKQRKSVKNKRENLYQVNYYSDGTSLNIIRLKSTIQEAEMHELADVIGKIAYYLDAPRLTYWFKGNSNTKGLQYFRRYLRRVMDAWAQNDEEKYVEAMKTLFLSYGEDDFLCKFKGNFQFNEYIKRYLYDRFDWKAPPANWSNWKPREDWMRSDQLLKQEGRYEYKPEIWDRHLDAAVEIAANAKIDVIAKAFTHILNDVSNRERLMSSLTIEQIVQLSASRYKPLSDLFIGMLLDRLEHQVQFDTALLAIMLQSESENMRESALRYAERILAMEGQDYSRFIIELAEIAQQLQAAWPESFKDLMERSLEKLSLLTLDEKAALMQKAWSALSDSTVSGDTRAFLMQMVFAPSLDDLKAILKTADFSPYMLKCESAAALLLAIRNGDIPADGAIGDILEKGTAKMLKTLVDVIEGSRDRLLPRLATILLLLESDIDSLNRIAQETISGLAGEQQEKMLALAIDSPIPKACAYGLEKLKECYDDIGQMIPRPLIAQMLEHNAPEVKSYISDKVNAIIEHPQNCDPDIFVYYVKTLLFLPNKVSKSKNRVYGILPLFIEQYADRRPELEDMLLDLGGSNIILDSERALVTLARIRKEVV